MIYILLGISITINILFIVGLILVFKFRNKFKKDICSNLGFSEFFKDDYNFLDDM